MRFRVKSAQEFWALSLAIGINTAVAFAHIPSWQNSPLGIRALIIIIPFTAVALLCYSFFASLWQMGDDGLRQRMLPWIGAKIDWSDVTRIESSRFAPYHDLSIEYNRNGFAHKIGVIWLKPTDREQFLDILRHFAPNAQYIDISAGKILNI